MTATLRSESSESAPYSWAEHLIWMEGGEPVEGNQRGNVALGVTIVVAVTAVAFGLGWIVLKTGWTHARLLDPILIGMLLGLVVGNGAVSHSLLPGASFAVRRLLPLGIVLLGARMNFLEAIRIGASGLAMSFGVVTLAIGLLLWLGKRLGLDRDLALLLGIGTGICGGTAIVALAPLLKSRENHVLVSVGIITLIGLVAMILLPLFSTGLGLTESQFGLLAGLTIHQTPQVIAAGFAVGEEAGQVATIAKLSRVCLLAPVAILLGWWVTRSTNQRRESGRPWYRLIPGFVIGFLLVALAKTFGLFPDISLEWSMTGVEFDSADFIRWISTFLLAAGMVGVGFQTRFSQSREVGWRPVFASTLGSIIITIISVAVIRAFI